MNNEKPKETEEEAAHRRYMERKEREQGFGGDVNARKQHQDDVASAKRVKASRRRRDLAKATKRRARGLRA